MRLLDQIRAAYRRIIRDLYVRAYHEKLCVVAYHVRKDRDIAENITAEPSARMRATGRIEGATDVLETLNLFSD